MHSSPAGRRLYVAGTRKTALDDERAVLEKLEYIHNNPVKRTLAAKPCERLRPSWHAYNDNVRILPLDLVFGEALGVAARVKDGILPGGTDVCNKAFPQDRKCILCLFKPFGMM